MRELSVIGQGDAQAARDKIAAQEEPDHGPAAGDGQAGQLVRQ